MKLTKKRKQWLEQRNNPPITRGKTLQYPDRVGKKYANQIGGFYETMALETEREILKLFRNSDSKMLVATQDASIVSQVRIALSKISKKYTKILNSNFSKIVSKMLSQVDRASKSSTHASLKELSGGLNVKTAFLTGEMSETFKALTQQNVSLFKTISEQHFSKVESKVMDSITNGKGLQDLQPFFEQYTNGHKNYAKNRAMDQTRKAYMSINNERIKKLGVKKVEWVHSHGSNDPRKLHQELDGKIFDIDNPPLIGVMYGQDIYGWGGELPHCRCTIRPVMEFGE